MNADAIRASLQCGRRGCPCRLPRGPLHCPAHDDRRPSLSIREDGDRLLWFCHAGCSQQEVHEALRRRGLLNGLAASPETRYDIRDESGRLIATHIRTDAPGGKRFRWEREGRPGLNGLPVADLPFFGSEQLAVAPNAPVVICEGEKAALAARQALGDGFVALGTVTGAAATPGDAALRPLLGREIVLWPDADGPGQQHMRRIAMALHRLGQPAERIRVATWPEAQPGDDAADALERHGQGVVRRLVTAARPWAPPVEPAGHGTGIDVGAISGNGAAEFRLAAVGDLLAEPEEAVAWTVDGMLPSGGVSIMAAKPKVGKSTTARCLALAVARGQPFLGRATARGPVIYLALEEKRSEIAKHFRRQGATEDDQIRVHVGMAPESAMEALAIAIHEHRPALVVVDPLLKLVRVRDANDYAEVTRALEPVIELARRSGAHILLVHHIGKGERLGGDAILGSTALFGAVDTALLMRRNPTDGTRTIETIQRYGDDLPESVVALDEQTGTVALAGSVAERRLAEAEQAILAALGSEPMTEPDVREATELRGALVSQALRNLVAQGAVLRTGTGRKGDPYRYSREEREKREEHSENAGRPVGWEENLPRRDAGFGGNSDSLPLFPTIYAEEREGNFENGMDEWTL